MKVSYSWSNQPSGMKSKVPSDEYYHYGDNVMVDTTYNNKSGYKEEKIDINEGTMPSSQQWYDIAYGNGKYVAIAGNSSSNVFAYSTDGINWTQGTMSSSQNWSSVCYGNGKFVAITYNSNIFAYSTNGTSWTQGTMPISQDWYSVCYGNGKYVAVGYNSNVFAYSTDGINWTQGTMPSKQKLRSVCYGNGKYVAVGYNSNVFAYSTDGINWTQGTFPSSQNWSSVCYGNGKYVVIVQGDSNVFAYSTDGINWTEGTLPYSENGLRICYGNGMFMFTVVGAVYYSYDAITWTRQIMSGIYFPICYGNDKFITIKSQSNVFACLAVSASYYQFSGWNKSDFNITADTAVSGSWSQVSSGGGVNFSELNTTSFGSRYAYGCIYAFDKYIVVGGDYRESTNFISYSNDCKSFTAIKPLSGSGSTFFSDLTFGNNILIATKRNGEYNYIARTTDGVNWTIVTISNTSRNWYSAVYGANKFVLFSNGYIAYSTDAINWTEKANAITINGNGCGPGYHSVIYDGQKFWARVNYQLKYCYSYSTDGINWTTTQVSQPWGNGSPSIYYCNGYSICYTSGNKGFKLYVSNDNITFTEHYSRADASNGWVYSNIIDYNGMYMFTLSTNSTGKIYLVYSTDLYNWNEFLIVEDTSILPICKAVYCDPNGKVFTVTSNNSMLYSFNISKLILIN